jgi:hypothetical protein
MIQRRYAKGQESISQGLKPAFLADMDAWAKAQASISGAKTT